MKVGKYSFGIGDRFGQQGIAQLKALETPAIHNHETWFTHAIESALALDPLFTSGANNILKTLLNIN